MRPRSTRGEPGAGTSIHPPKTTIPAMCKAPRRCSILARGCSTNLWTCFPGAPLLNTFSREKARCQAWETPSSHAVRVHGHPSRQYLYPGIDGFISQAHPSSSKNPFNLYHTSPATCPRHEPPPGRQAPRHPGLRRRPPRHDPRHAGGPVCHEQVGRLRRQATHGRPVGGPAGGGFPTQGKAASQVRQVLQARHGSTAPVPATRLATTVPAPTIPEINNLAIPSIPTIPRAGTHETHHAPRLPRQGPPRKPRSLHRRARPGQRRARPAPWHRHRHARRRRLARTLSM